MRSIRLFWWSPVRSLQLAKPEILGNPGSWIRLAASTKRLGLNFGDEYSSLIVEAATRRKVKWANFDKADLIAVGSVIELYAANSRGAAVWGSGLREGGKDVQPERFGQILAVRGPDSLLELGLPKSIPVGDPGVLVPMLVGPRSTRIKRDVVFVPHFRTWATGSGRSMLREIHKRDIRILPPTLDPIVMAKEIRDAHFVFTSSLHGLVFANAFGVPAQLVSASNASSSEPDFKYMDYLRSMNAPYESITMQTILSKEAVSSVLERKASSGIALERRSRVLGEGLLSSISELE